MELALFASFAIATISVIGALTFASERIRTAAWLIPFAVGVFLSVVFFELLPEAFHEGGAGSSSAIAVGFLTFFLISRLLHTFHHHHEDCTDPHNTKSASTLVLIGDSIHNFTDGIVISTAFMVSPVVGIATTIGIALHEIPQEIAELSILLNAGYSKKKAVLLNFISALTIILGVGATFLFLEFFESFFGTVIGFVAGSILYIAASDLLPRLHTETRGSFWYTFSVTTLGLILMATLLTFSH